MKRKIITKVFVLIILLIVLFNISNWLNKGSATANSNTVPNNTSSNTKKDILYKTQTKVEEFMVHISNEEYEDFKARYIQDTRIIGRGASATKAYIMEKTDWSLSQIHMLIMKIGKEVRDEELRDSKVITSYNIDS